MSTLLAFLRDSETGEAAYAVVATEAGATYVYPGGDIRPFDEVRGAPVNDPDRETPQDAAGWMELALTNPGTGLLVQEPFDLPNEDEALDEAQLELDPENASIIEQASDEEWRAGQAADEITVDDPTLFEEVGADNPNFDRQAFLNYVTMAMGDIDPEGPNAWLLDAAEGKQVPEDAYLSFGPAVPEDEAPTNSPETEEEPQ